LIDKLDLPEVRFLLPIAAEETKSVFPVLCDHEKALYAKVNSVKVAASLFFPDFSMADSTAAKVNQKAVFP
jgi:hypothetical protein